MCVTCPPAAHAATRPYCPPSFFSRCATVVTRRQPVAPNGCPMDSEPPHMLNLSMGGEPTWNMSVYTVNMCNEQSTYTNTHTYLCFPAHVGLSKPVRVHCLYISQDLTLKQQIIKQQRDQPSTEDTAASVPRASVYRRAGRLVSSITAILYNISKQLVTSINCNKSTGFIYYRSAHMLYTGLNWHRCQLLKRLQEFRKHSSLDNQRHQHYNVFVEKDRKNEEKRAKKQRGKNRKLNYSSS